MTWDRIVVALAVAGAGIYILRMAYRMFYGKSTGCGCGASCPASRQETRGE